jgi:predicted Zn-dependent protease
MLLLRTFFGAQASRTLLAVAALLLAASCAQNPVSGRSDFVVISEDQELRMGRSFDQQVKKETPVYDHKNGDREALAAYVERLGQNLARVSHRANIEYRFSVIDSPDVNAFALPGGYIYITRGILAYLNSEAELAAVLGHEIGHVTARHSVRQISAQQGASIGITLAAILIPGMRNVNTGNMIDIAANAWLSGYGREHELEADRLGAEYLTRTGYPAQAMIDVIGVLKNQEKYADALANSEGRKPRAYHGLFATHPDNDTRLKEVISAAAKSTAEAMAASGGVQVSNDRKRDVFLEKMDGVTFADSLSQGVVRDNVFYHPELKLVMRFPQGFRVINQPTRLVAIAPDGQLTMELFLETAARNAAPADILRRKASIEGGIDQSAVNGHPAALANVRGDRARAGVIQVGGNTFALVTQAKTPQVLRTNVEASNTVFRSMREYQDTDALLAKPLRMKIIRAEPGMTYAALAEKSPLGRTGEAQLRLINAQYPQGEPVPGSRIKIIE